MATVLASDAELLPAIERFIDAHAIPPTTFGRKAIGDANLIDDLRAGRELRRATERKVRQFMAERSSLTSLGTTPDAQVAA